jgi:pyruvate formate lyase activating enzyme
MKEGYISSIESFATLEGQGVRSAVFFAGCPLRCVYCHNPETRNPAGAQTVSSVELAKKLARYKPYYGSDGGVTLSGGEPLLQAEFALDLTLELKKLGIGTCADTSVSVFNDKVCELYDALDFVIADLKFTSAADYEKYCKNPCFDTVISSFEYLNSLKKPVYVRTVIVPGINDTPAHISAYRAFLSQYGNIKGHKFVPFHTLGFGKYEKLGIINPLLGTPPMDSETLKNLTK